MLQGLFDEEGGDGECKLIFFLKKKKDLFDSI
jgi:hypothetical protein